MSARACALFCVMFLSAGPAVLAQNFRTSTSFCTDAGHTASVALGDLDGDGDLDLVFGAGRHAPETNWVYYNDGKGNFLGRRALGDELDRTYRAELGDVDGDGDLDVVTVNDIGEWGKIHFNDGRGVFAKSMTFGSNAYASRDVKLADLDGDGDVDIVVGNTIFGRNMLYMNDGAEKFTGRSLGAERRLTIALAIGDLDSDGDVDIVAGNRAPPTIAYLNDGVGNFSDSSTIGGGKDVTVAVVLGDLDGDGDLDLVTGNWGPRTSRVDADGDGFSERWIEETGEEMSRVYLNDGRANFTMSYTFGVGNDRIRSLALGDVDLDGDLDIVSGSDCQTNKVFYNLTRP